MTDTTTATPLAGDSKPAARRASFFLREGIHRYREGRVLRRSDPRFKRALEIATRIEGFTAPVELSLLYHLSLATPGTDAVVEIGSYLGRSTVVLACAAADTERGPVVAVDPHTAALGVEGEQERDTREQFLSNVEEAGVRSHVRLFHMTSLEAAAAWDGGSVRILFVDGWHSREAVLADFHAWAPYLADSHCVVFDDFLPFASVRAAVRELRALGAVSGEGLIVGKMAAFGPPEVMRSVSVPPGARILAKLSDRVLDWAIKHLAT